MLTPAPSPIQRTLASRLSDAPAGSYTKRLFDDPELLRNKLLEEAQELAEAREPDHVAAETADLLYFALVACTKVGVTLADVEGHLTRRSLKVRRRAGDSKQHRIEAAAKQLQEIEAAKLSATASEATAAQ
jgi:phosphoribosyl-ATP pyrophosphohydrolase